MTHGLGDYLVLVALSVSGLLGWFLNGYLGRKGQNLATHEDIQKLLDQVKVTTQMTESIKADLTGKLWLSQERWRIKTDLYISLLTLLDSLANDSTYVAKRLRHEKVPEKRTLGDTTAAIQKIVVLAQILNPNIFKLLQELPLANVPKEGETELDRAERLEQDARLYRKLYLAVGTESRRDLGLEGFVA